MSWDYRQQPNLDELDRIVANMSASNERMIRIHQVDTGGDDYGIVVTDQDLTKAQVNERWDAWWRSDR